MLTKKANANKLLKKGNDFFNKSEWDKALECWEKTRKIYDELGDKQGISYILNDLGNVYHDKGEWDRALEYYKKSLKISEEFGDKQGISYALNNLGNLYYDKGEWDRALEYYKKSLKIKEEIGDEHGISYTFGNLGNLYKDKGEWDRALEYYKKSLKISEEFGDKHGISYTLNNLGNVYYDKGEWDRALEYYEKDLKISEELGDKQVISITLGNLGSVYQDKGEWDRALEYYEKSLKIKEELGNKQGISITFANLGNMYQDKGEWDRALEYYEKDLKISEELGDKHGISITLNNIGEINIKNGNWNEARMNLEKSLAMAKNLAPISTVDALANLGELYRLEEQYNDSLANLESAKQIVNQVGSKPKEIYILEKLGDTHLDKYIAYKIEENLSSAEKFYTLALKLAQNLKMVLNEATTVRGIGVVQAKKRELVASKRNFIKSIEVLRNLGAFFELQKTLLEYARVLYESNVLIEAEMIAKNVAFDSLRNDYRELLVKAYLLLGDIEIRKENQYEYYLEALKASEFNPKIYVRTCFIMIFRMKTMESHTLLKFIESLKEVNKGRDIYFNQFLEALNAKLEGKEYDISGLPISLEQEFNRF